LRRHTFWTWTLSWIALGLLFGCSDLPTKSSQSPVADEQLKTTYTIVNLGSAFERFWSLAKTKSFEEQLKIWNEVVEGPYRQFYDGMVWQKKENPKWEERKIRRLKEFFPKYQSLYGGMKAEFDQFDRTLKKQIDRFAQFFPDSHFNLPIYAAPTTTFNGKGGEGGDSGDPLGKTVLAFGIDMIIDRKDNPDVLYSHELFHIYHTAAASVSDKVFSNEGKLTLPLWLEGLATYVSQQMNSQASLADILMDKDLPNLTKKQIQFLAKKFVSESGQKAFDPAKPEFYKKWFAIDPQYSLGPALPQRCGYLLGLKVSERLAKKNKLQDMVHWNVAEAHRQVVKTLNEIALGQ
jgi:hypothetical protein